MNKISSTFLNACLLIFVFSLCRVTTARSENTIEVPASVLFGGITIRFEEDARKLIGRKITDMVSDQKKWKEKQARAALFFPIVENVLEHQQVPVDFKYVAFQRSTFLPELVSEEKVTGFWQFTPESVRDQNLRIDRHVDERKNISSSTYGAAGYLKKHNKHLSNWFSVLCAYYLNETGIKQIIPAFGSYDSEVILNEKTDRSILAFFACKIAYESAMENARPDNSIILIETNYGKGKSLVQISKELGITKKELHRYNRWLKSDIVPDDREYFITLPVSSSMIISVNSKLLPQKPTAISSSAVSEPEFPVLKRYEVESNQDTDHVFFEINGLPGIQAKAGDNAKSIAKAGSLRKPQFLKYNDMSPEMPIVAGKVYYLALKNKHALTPFHTARPGDSWRSISQQYGIRVISLLKYNTTIFNNSPLQTGQVVWMDKKRPKHTLFETISLTQGDTTVAGPIYTKTAGDQLSTVKEITDQVYTETSYGQDENHYKPEKSQWLETEGILRDTIYNIDRLPVADSFVMGEQVVFTGLSANGLAVVMEDTLKAGQENVLRLQASEPASTHTVKAGQTFYSISKLYRLKVQELLAMNHLNRIVPIYVGQKLIIKKQSSDQISRFNKITLVEGVGNSPAKIQQPKVHKVSAGETVFSISRSYKVNIADLVRENHLSGYSIKVGQKLAIP